MLDEKIRRSAIFNNRYIKNVLLLFAYFVAGFALSRGRVIDNLHPLGVSLVAVSKKWYSVFAAAGALIGYITLGINVYSVRYIAATLMALLGAFAASVFELNFRPYYAMTINLLVVFATGVVRSINMAENYNSYMLILCESILSGGATYFFYRALNANYKRLRLRALPVNDIACILISAVLVCMNLAYISIATIHPVRIFAMLAILVFIRYGGERIGLVMAISLGFAMGIGSSGSLLIVGAFSFSALLCTLFTSLSTVAIGASFFSGMLFFSMLSGSDMALPLFIESLIAVLVFVLMPNVLCDKLAHLFDSGRDYAPDGSLRQSLVIRLRFASNAMAAISDSVDQVRERINDLARIDNERHRQELSTEEYIRREIVLDKTNQIRMVASDQFYSISGMLEDLAHEFDEAEMFDSTASSKIRQVLGEYNVFPKNISAIEDKYGRMRVEILVDGECECLNDTSLATDVGKACNRYFDGGRVTEFTDETMLSFSEKPNYKLPLAMAQHSANGNMCGDTVKAFNDNRGHTILVISDGMGKGSRAALDGAMGAGLMAKLINAGFGFDSALKVVNSALLVKSNDESLATLDIASVDLFTGKCEMFKAGAPASFIVSNGNVIKCELTSMPAGILRGIEFAKRTAVLKLDDLIVLMSDGITDLGDDFVQNVLINAAEMPIDDMAQYVVDEALKISNQNNRIIDDMSVIIARVERN